MSETNTCGCAPSPPVKGVGWHILTEEQYAEKRHNGKQTKKLKKHLK